MPKPGKARGVLLVERERKEGGDESQSSGSTVYNALACRAELPFHLFAVSVWLFCMFVGPGRSWKVLP